MQCSNFLLNHVDNSVFKCLHLIIPRYTSMLLLLTAGLGQILQKGSMPLHRPYFRLTQLEELAVFPGKPCKIKQEINYKTICKGNGYLMRNAPISPGMYSIS